MRDTRDGAQCRLTATFEREDVFVIPLHPSFIRQFTEYSVAAACGAQL